MAGSISEYGRTIYPQARLTINVRVIEVKTGLVNWVTEIKGRKANYVYLIELLKDIIAETVAKVARKYNRSGYWLLVAGNREYRNF